MLNLNWSKYFGISKESKLDEVPYFDLTKCLVIDIMHVNFQGVLVNEIAYVLLHCSVDRKYFSLDDLNRKLKYLPNLKELHLRNQCP